jgi:methionine aminotransferase
MIQLSSKLPQVGTTIFTVMSQLAHETGAINLSQGFPDYDCPANLVELVNQYMKKGNNQYAPMAGVQLLRERIAEKVNELHQANYHPESEVTVTAGGTQAIFTALAAVINQNDEVIIFEPAYDSYAPAIKVLGGIVKSMELAPPEYKIDWQMVKRLVSAKTRMIIINSPQNPTGTILTEDDIRELISITRGTDILILSDEVYEHLVFDGKKHLSMAGIPELQERSFVCASFGKLFHNTGWKIGYCIAPEKLMKEFRKVHQFLVFSVNTPFQHAIADFLANKNYYLELTNFYQQKRDYFTNLMAQTKFDLLPCYGSYFQTASYSKISEKKDTDFSKYLTQEYRVATIPISAFYNKGTDFGVIRFCFAKKQETLEQAVERLIKV